MANEQKLTNVNLTDAENKLMEVLLNPDNREKTITDICKVANISRYTYYASFKKPEFKRAYEQNCKELLEESLAPVINAFIKEAKKGSYYHGKTILEMAGMHTDKLSVSADVKVKIVDDIEDDIDDCE